MPDRIIALHRLDLPGAVQLANQLESQHGRRPLLQVVDPVLLNHAHSLGLTEVALLALPDCDVPVGCGAKALATTRLVQDAVDDVLCRLIPEARGAAWLGHWLRHLHLMAFGFRNIGRALSELALDGPVHLLVPEGPHRYGGHSFVPALMVSAALREAGQSPRWYRGPQPPWEPTQLPDAVRDDTQQPVGRAAGQVQVLCHLPTCFYDHALFAKEVMAAGLSALVMPSQLFDVALEGLPRTCLAAPEELMAGLTDSQRQALDTTMAQVGEVLSRHLGPLLGSAGPVAAQAAAMQQACRDNALVFFRLVERFAEQPPDTLLISNHDTGQHGAMLSFARRFALRTLVLPHSKIINVPFLGHGMALQCLGHAVQGGEVLDLNGNRLATGVLDFDEPISLPAARPTPLTRVGVVLNGLALSAMCLVDVEAYVRGLQRLRRWCSDHGVSCRIRCRPNESVASLLVQRLDLSMASLQSDQQGDLADFGRGCDLVLGYDSPTSGAIELLRQGLPMLQVLCRPLAQEEWRIVDSDLVPQLALDVALQQLDALHADPLALWQFRRDQSARFVAAVRRGRPLRAWLQDPA